MRFRIFALTYFSFCLSLLYAQDFTLNGKVISDAGKGVAYANLLLSRVSDSAVVNGVSSEEDGSYEFRRIPSGDYLLTVTYIGYALANRKIKLTSDSTLTDITLIPSEENLDEVTLKYVKPRLEKKADRMVFTVENTSLSQTSAYDILKHTPGVMVINDKVLVKNSSAEIYINDRRVYLNEGELKSLLEGYSGANIRSVEVITNPPARYDAEGGVVLNIVTSKGVSIGYKGSLQGRYTQGVYAKYQLGTEHYYKTDKLNFFAGYNYNPRKDYKSEDDHVNFFNGNTPDDRWLTDFRKTTTSDAHNLNAILDLNLGAKSSLSLSANAFYSPDKTNDINVLTNIYNQTGSRESYFKSLSELDNDNTNLNFNADYKLKLGEKGAELDLRSDFIYYDDSQWQMVSTDYFNTDGSLNMNNSFASDARQKNTIGTAQADLHIPSGESNLDTGLKYSAVNGSSHVDFSGAFDPVGAADDSFDYDEHILALYGSYAQEWEKWSLSMGLRGEYTDITGRSMVLGEVNTQNYFELFPTLSVQYFNSTSHIWGLSYKRSIKRPNYQSLNPYRYYLNENQFIAGNPDLRPSIEDKITFSYTLKQQFTFELYYGQVKNDLQSLVFQDNNNRFLSSSIYNIDSSRQFSLDFTYSGNPFSWWYLGAYSSIYYMENNFVAVESGNILQTNSTNGFIGSTFSRFTLSNDGTLALDASIDYFSNIISGSYKFRNQFSTTLAITKLIWKNRGIVTLKADDIFNTNNVAMVSRYRNQDNGYFARPESRTIMLGFRYKFGNFKLSDNKRNTAPSELDRLNEKPGF